MKKSKTITFRDKEITAHELTVHQVQTLLEKIEARTTEGFGHDFVLSALMDRDLPAEALSMAIPVLTAAEWQDAAPSELTALYDAAEELNPFLLKMYQKMTAERTSVVPGVELETAV